MGELVENGLSAWQAQDLGKLHTPHREAGGFRLVKPDAIHLAGATAELHLPSLGKHPTPGGECGQLCLCYRVIPEQI